MQVISSINDSSRLFADGCVATLGNFDGVHKGHQQLIGKVVNTAKERGLPSVVITFSPHPEHYFCPQSAPALLMTDHAKFAAIAELQVDYTLLLPFNMQLAMLSPVAFVRRVLLEGLNVRHLFVGHDYAFGKKRKGDAKLLTALGKRHGFTVEQMLPVYMLGSIISSTRIRNCVQTGNAETAAALMGHPYFLDGTVGHGKKRGADALGFPTANLACVDGLILPKAGVYAVRVLLGQDASKLPSAPPRDALYGVTNVGANPSFGDVPVGVETHLLDFTADIYHTPLRVWFLHRIRDERTFPSIPALATQIADDIVVARQLLQSS